MTSRVEGKELIMERTFNRTKELVFKSILSDSKLYLASWWGPQGWKTENKTFEFKPEGVRHYCMRCEDKTRVTLGWNHGASYLQAKLLYLKNCLCRCILRQRWQHIRSNARNDHYYAV